MPPGSLNRRSAVTLLTISITLSGTPIAPPARAQTPAGCDAAINTLERETDQLGAQLDRDVREFIRSEAAESALRGIRTHYKNKPTSEAMFDLKDKWDKWNEYVDHLRNARATLAEVQRCLKTPGCSLTELAKRQHQAMAKWIQSLGDEGLNAATERVDKAATLIQDYVDNTLSLALGGALAAAHECFARFEQQAGSSTTAPPAAPQMPAAADKPKGIGTGTLIALGATAAATGILLGQVASQTTDTITTIPPPTPAPITTTSCNHLGTSGNCSIQVQIVADAWAQTLTSAKRFNVYSVPRGANATACQLQTSVCFGPGCPGTGVRSLGADLRGLGTLTSATVTIVPIDSGTPGPASWDVNLTQCFTRLRYP